MKANLLVERLELHAYHGWFPHEGEFGQAFTIDLSATVDIGRASATDHLSDALDYGALIAATRRLFTQTPHKLVETAIVFLGRGLLEEFPMIQDIFVRVRKVKPPIPERMSAAGIEMLLTRD